MNDSLHPCIWVALFRRFNERWNSTTLNRNNYYRYNNNNNRNKNNLNNLNIDIK